MRVVKIGSCAPVLQPIANLSGVNETGVYPAGDTIVLLPGAVGALPRALVVVGPVERHELVPLTLRVVHLVALVYGDLVHLYGAPRLAGHEYLRGDDLNKEHRLEDQEYIVWGFRYCWFSTTLYSTSFCSSGLTLNRAFNPDVHVLVFVFMFLCLVLFLTI